MTETTRLILITLFWASLAATSYTYFLYPLLLQALSFCLARRRAHPSLAHVDLDDVPTVTMIISAYNEQTVLPDKIANCRYLAYPPRKLSFIIGSDGSDDGTAGIMDDLRDQRFTTVANQFRSGKASMLNQLVKLATSDIIIFSDANTMYRPDAIWHLAGPFQDKRVGCAIGHLELSAPSDDAQSCRPEGLYWRYENRIKQMESTLGAVPAINGGIFAIRRDLYQPLPPHAVTEDQVLGMKIMTQGYRCLLADQAHATESVSNWAGELRRRTRISAGNFQSLLLVPAILNPRHGWTWFTFLSHKLLRWLVPFFLATMLLCNVLLVGKPFYGASLLAQGLFYASGLAGVMLGQLVGIAKVLSLPKYFLTMNLAILIGLTRFLTKKQKVTWAKAKR